MNTVIDYALSYAPPTAAEREALSLLTPDAGPRWHQKLDHALLTVTALHAGTPVGLGVLHLPVTAPPGSTPPWSSARCTCTRPTGGWGSASAWPRRG